MTTAAAVSEWHRLGSVPGYETSAHHKGVSHRLRHWDWTHRIKFLAQHMKASNKYFFWRGGLQMRLVEVEDE